MKYGSPDLKFEIGADDSGTSMVDLSEYVDTINELNIEAPLQEGHGFGHAWVKQLWSKIKQCNPVTVEGFYDDSPGGPHETLNAIGEVRPVSITWGGSKKSSFDAVITNYSRTPSRGELTRYSCTLTSSGAVEEV